MAASYGGYIECMGLLIERVSLTKTISHDNNINHFQGADTTVRDNEGMCALHWSVLRGHLDAVRLLLGRGAHVNNIATQQQQQQV